MSFAATDRALAAVLFKQLGQLADYATEAGAVTPDVDVIVDRGVALAPEGFQSQVSERRTLVSLLDEQVPTPRRGDTVTLASGEVLVLEHPLSDDGVERRFVTRG